MMHPNWAPIGTRIIQYVSHCTGISPEDIRGPRRFDRIAKARQIACWVMHYATDYGYTKIARTVGRSNHTTAMHAVKMIDQWRETNPTIRAVTNDVLEFVREDENVRA